jgi:hypothetical protein
MNRSDSSVFDPAYATAPGARTPGAVCRGEQRPYEEIESGTAAIWLRISPPGFRGVWTFT